MDKFIVSFLIFFSVMISWGQTPKAGTPVTAAGAEEEAAKPEVSGEQRVSEIQKYLKPFFYNREEYRDPFETQGGTSPLKPGQVYGPFLPLQNFRLSKFRLKGLTWGNKRPVAIFEGPNEEEHRLHIKDYVGENFGYIASIREKEVVVIQTIEENQKRYSTTKVIFLE